MAKKFNCVVDKKDYVKVTQSLDRTHGIVEIMCGYELSKVKLNKNQLRELANELNNLACEIGTAETEVNSND